MFFDFGLKLMARQATNTRAVTLEGTPVGSTLTYNPGTDRTVPTDRFIHFAITRKSSIITLWWGGTQAATVSHGELFTRLADRKSTRLKSVTNAPLVCRLLIEKKKKKKHEQ